MEQVKQLIFDLSTRKLEVFHTNEVQPIHELISELNLQEKLEGTEDSELAFVTEATHQRKILWWVLAINAGFFVIEMTTGMGVCKTRREDRAAGKRDPSIERYKKRSGRIRWNRIADYLRCRQCR